jgi:hypothetical protein
MAIWAAVSTVTVGLLAALVVHIPSVNYVPPWSRHSYFQTSYFRAAKTSANMGFLLQSFKSKFTAISIFR